METSPIQIWILQWKTWGLQWKSKVSNEKFGDSDEIAMRVSNNTPMMMNFPQTPTNLFRLHAVPLVYHLNKENIIFK